MGTVFVGGALLAVIGIVIRSMYKDAKRGKSPICGGDCSHCGGVCHEKNNN